MASKSSHRRAQRSDTEPNVQGAISTIPALAEDPYRYIEHLGDGAYGSVDKVERAGRVFARKRILFSTGRDQAKMLRSTLQEFNILNRLKHRHIVDVVEIFYSKARLYIIMDQVADTNLAQYLDKVDSLLDKTEKMI